MRCPACGADNPADVPRCPQCGERLTRRSRRSNHSSDGDDPAITPVPDPNPLARIAYRYAVMGLIPLVGLIFGPLALAWGILGLRREKVNPSIKGRARCLFGIGLGSLELLTNWIGLALILVGLGALR